MEDINMDKVGKFVESIGDADGCESTNTLVMTSLRGSFRQKRSKLSIFCFFLFKKCLQG